MRKAHFTCEQQVTIPYKLWASCALDVCNPIKRNDNSVVGNTAHCQHAMVSAHTYHSFDLHFS